MQARTRALLAATGLAILAGCAGERPATVVPEPKPPVEARASVDRAVATTGDLITYRVTLERDPQVVVELGEPGAEIGGFRVVDLGREPTRKAGDRVVEERWYELRADLVGSYVLPPVTVRFRRPAGDAGGAAGETESEEWHSLETSAIFVEVASVLPAEGEARDIRDIKPLRRVAGAFPWLRVASALAAVLLTAATAWWIIRRRRRRVEEPADPPHVVAFRALDELRGTDLDDREAVRRFYFQLSEVIRAYVEGRFGLNASDLTTEEIVERLPFVTTLAAEPRRHLEEFLAGTDRVKFAHHDPARSEIETAWEQGLGFVEATRPAEAEMEEAA